MSTRHTVQIPIDCRLGCCSLWVASFVLALVDSIDDRLGILALWAGMLALVAAVWTTAQLLAHSRKVLLDVMSYEHRLQTPSMGPSPVVVPTSVT